MSGSVMVMMLSNLNEVLVRREPYVAIWAARKMLH